MEEYRFAIGVIRVTQLMGKYHRAFYDDNKSIQTELLDEIIAKLPPLIGSMRDTWLMRNRYSYLDDSLTRLTSVLKRAEDLRKELNA